MLQGVEDVNRIVIVVLGVALLLAACTTPDPPTEAPSGPATPTPTGPPSYSGPEIPRLDWSEVWKVRPKGLKAVHSVDRVGSRLVLWGDKPDDEPTMMVLDAESGKVLWDDGDLPARLSTKLGPIGPYSDEGWAQTRAETADDGRGGVVIFTYERNPCRDDSPECRPSQQPDPGGEGLIAVSLVDRSVRWATEVTPSILRLEGERSAVRMDLVGASDSVIAAMTFSSGLPPRDPGLATVGIDPRTGKRLWRAEQVLPSAVEGDRVLALTSPKGDDRHQAAGTPVILDAHTGTKIAKVAVAEPSIWNNPADGLATVFSYGDSEPKIPVIRLSDGRAVIKLPASDWPGHQVADSTWGPLVWWLDGATLFSQAMGDPTPLVAPIPEKEERGTLLSAQDDHVWMEKSPDSRLAYDRSGRGGSDLVSGTVLPIDDELIMNVRPEGTLRLLRLT